MDRIIIRPARDDDLETMKQIAVEAWEPIYQSFRELTGDELFATLNSEWREHKAGQVAGHYRNYPDCTLVTEYNGRVVGFITYNLFERRKLGVIGNNAVHPDYQGRGFGTKQYEKVLEIFRENGMLYAEVITGSDNAHAPARAAYEKVGFEPMVHMVQYYRKL